MSFRVPSNPNHSVIIQQGYSPSRWSQTPQCPCTNPWVCPNPSPFADTILPTCDIQRAGGMLWKSPGCCRSTGMLAASRQGGQGSAMLREHFACHHPCPVPLGSIPTHTQSAGHSVWSLSPSMTLHGHAWNGGGSCLHTNSTKLCAALLLHFTPGVPTHPPRMLRVPLPAGWGTGLPSLLAGTSHAAEAFCPSLGCTPTLPGAQDPLLCRDLPLLPRGTSSRFLGTFWFLSPFPSPFLISLAIISSLSTHLLILAASSFLSAVFGAESVPAPLWQPPARPHHPLNPQHPLQSPSGAGRAMPGAGCQDVLPMGTVPCPLPGDGGSN